MSNSEYIVLDIETVPQENQPEWMKEYISKKTENKRGENRGNDQRYSSINPEFGQIVAIGLYDSSEDFVTVLKSDYGENKMLQCFWDFYKNNIGKRLITFNGKKFDTNYINVRSCINKVNNYNISIPNRRYDFVFHYDILEILSNFYTLEMHGLNTYCEIYGIPNEDDVDGSDVYELYKKGEHDKIYKHCINDVKKANLLYLRVKDYI